MNIVYNLPFFVHYIIADTHRYSQSDGFSIDSLYHLCYNYKKVVYSRESLKDPHNWAVLNSIKKVRKGI
jgi:hypothetical protein